MEKEMELLKEIAQAITDIGGKMFFVGGYVRDRLIGKDSKDIDVEIHGITEEQLVEVLAQFGHVDKIGASFGVYLIKGVDIDFAMPRTETKTGDLHTDFDVTVDPFIGTYGASRRRDFTMNAIMENVVTGEIIDHFNGRQDIADRVIRMVDEETFKEDALRVLRAIQFSARFDFWLDSETRRVASGMTLHHLAKERVYVEIRKGLEKGSPMLFVSLLKSFRNVVDVMPSLDFVKFGRLERGRSLPFQVAMMGMDMSDEQFQQLIVDFIEKKQERKTARACLNFFLGISIHAFSDKGMAETISLNKSFMVQNPEDVEFITNTFFTEMSGATFRKINEKRLNCSLRIDGKWLIDRGLQPSSTFADSLHRAEVMAWLGSSEEEIVTTVIGSEFARS